LLLAAGVYIAIVEPVVSTRARMETHIDTLSKDLATMESLATQIERLQQRVATTKKPETAGAGFSLFSFIDKATTASVSREAVASMNPSRRPAREGLEESAVELRLSSVALPELVGLLQQIENATEPVYIKRLELKRRYDDQTHFDVVIVAGSLSRT
jgi:type II secretory pathway component PulM